MPKKEVSTSEAPAAIGPYSQGIIAEGRRLVFVSGQLPLDPQTGEFAGDSIGAQTRRSLENVKAVLAAAGAEMDAVIKTTVFLQNMGDFAGMNEVYQEFFHGVFPCRAAIEAAALPKGALVEIEAIAMME
ncbi:RidA family protein [Candidatus Zixiibacteriota bacterium]